MVAEYIEREALLAAYDKAHVGPPGGARKLIAEAPAVDVAPVVHGRWIEENKGPVFLWHCSECKTMGSPVWKGCPVCLARMDGE